MGNLRSSVSTRRKGRSRVNLGRVSDGPGAITSPSGMLTAGFNELPLVDEGFRTG